MEQLKIEDLMGLCSGCKGSGKPQYPPLPSNVQRTADFGVCPVCQGTGTELTPNGAVLFEFIQKVKNRPVG